MSGDATVNVVGRRAGRLCGTRGEGGGIGDAGAVEPPALFFRGGRGGGWCHGVTSPVEAIVAELESR